MSVEAFRITRTQYVATAFDGEGARLHGGRWNSIGTRAVYAAASRSLATLEVLVHLEDVSAIAGRYSIIPVSFPEALVTRIEARDLPEDWDSPVPAASTQMIGDAWVKEGASAVLAVPSAIIPGEWNYLLNPAHPEFTTVLIGAAEPFRVGARLAGGARGPLGTSRA